MCIDILIIQKKTTQPTLQSVVWSLLFIVYYLLGVQYQENSGFKAAASSSFCACASARSLPRVVK